VFVCIENDHFRKPSTDIFRYIISDFNNNVEPDLNVCFYCGDAAGRPVGVSKSGKKDHSCTDRKFAWNNNLKFYTPEAYFLELEEGEFNWGFNPIDFLNSLTINEPYKAEDIISKEQEMLLLVGPPASGKSTFSNKYLVPNGYERINRDTLKTVVKCKAAAKKL